MPKITPKTHLSRRTALAAGTAALALPAVLRPRAARADNVIKIGYVSPITGPLAAFGVPVPYVLSQVRKILEPGITLGGQTYAVEILDRDTQSSASRAADVTAALINTDNVDLILGDSAPDTVNPVADQAEANQVPCITTDSPWQTFFFGRHGDPKVGFNWTYHFFWGLEDVEAAYTAMWDGITTNKIVGGMFPNNVDGNVWGDPHTGFPGILPGHGYKLISPGRYEVLSTDYSAQISAFKQAGCDLVVGNFTPPDFTTFWTQAGQQGFHPKVVSIGKALLFPSVIGAIGPRANGLSTEVWWSPHHPFTSGLTQQTAGQLCDAYTAATGKPWTQPLGYKHGLLEVAIDVLKRAKSKSPADILASIQATNYNSIVGPVQWTGKPVKNVCKMPLVGGQWHFTDGKPSLVVAENKTYPQIPVGSPLVPIA